MKRVHIVGCPRSGTSLLLELVATCFDCAGRSDFERSIFKPVDRNGGVHVSKHPTNILHIRHVFTRDDNLFLIYIVRDPRSVITSHYPGDRYTYFCHYPLWKRCENAAGRLRGHPRFMELLYEDLVTDPDACQETIQRRFTFLKKKYRFSELTRFARPSHHSVEAMGGLRNVDESGVGKWKHHLSRVKQQLMAHPALQKDLERRGYESDDAWQSRLDEVEPRVFSCRYQDRYPPLRNIGRKVSGWVQSVRYLKRMNH